MNYSEPTPQAPGDRGRVLTRPHTRIEGPLKVTGTAPYAYERHDVAEGQLYGWPVGAGIGQGRVLSIDTDAARAAPGVVDIVTTLDMEILPASYFNPTVLFGGPMVKHYHQAIAVVIAETLEQARGAAALLKIEYREDEARFDFEEEAARIADEEVKPLAASGDFDTAFAEAEVTLDETYTTPAQTHVMMEPHATIASWTDDGLTIWTSTQMVQWNKLALGTTLRLSGDEVRVDSPYVGGGFGGKLYLRADAVMAALASKKVGRPVKVTLPRPMIMNNTTHRSSTIQRLRIGASRDGRITAIGHDSISEKRPGGKGENAVDQTRHFYAGENRLIVNRVVEMDLPESNDMRAPGEAVGLMALEAAMDEMAEKLGMDPIEFRTVNDTQVDPDDPRKPFSDRNFVECMRQGAELFGWSDRSPTPAATREGQWLIGHGMAGAYRGSLVMTSGARARLQPDGRLVIETDMTDIGTGSYTALAQTAAEMLGLEVGQVDMRLGNSDFPTSSGSGGQFGGASSTAGVYAACVGLRAEIARRLGNADADTLEFSGGSVRQGERSTPLAEIAADGEIVAEDKMTFGKFRNDYAHGTFGAHFAKVAVHALTGEVRVRKMVAVCDSGRILNPVTSRSQIMGAMVMGVGSALTEDLHLDTGRGFFANHDMAGYEVPVHADIPEQIAVFLDTDDPISTPLRAKGVAELGICGVAAAVANAVYNATGVRVRDYPITPDKLIAHLPPA